MAWALTERGSSDASQGNARATPLPPFVNGTSHGARLHPGSLYHTPMIPILLIAASTPILGRARAVVRETEQVLAYHHTRPNWPVHIVVIPKRHVPSLCDLGDRRVLVATRKKELRGCNENSLLSRRLAGQSFGRRGRVRGIGGSRGGGIGKYSGVFGATFRIAIFLGLRVCCAI